MIFFLNYTSWKNIWVEKWYDLKLYEMQLYEMLLSRDTPLKSLKLSQIRVSEHICVIPICVEIIISHTNLAHIYIHMCAEMCNFFFQQQKLRQYALHIYYTHGRGIVAMINKWNRNPHMWFNTLPNRATQETLLIECLTCLKLRLGWGKNKVAQGLNTLSLWSY